MNIDSIVQNMEKMSRAELVSFADAQGVKVHWKAKPQTIIKSVVDKLTHPVPVAKVRTDDETPEEKIERLKAERTITNTREQIEELLLKNKQRQPALDWKLSDDDCTMHVRCRGAEICLNWNIPLRVIQRELDKNVMRGALMPISLTKHFDDTGYNPGSPKNQYTNLVMGGSR